MKMLKKAAYISVELVIIAGIVLVVGMIATTVLVQKARIAGNKANVKIEHAFENAQITVVHDCNDYKVYSYIGETADGHPIHSIKCHVCKASLGTITGALPASLDD